MKRILFLLILLLTMAGSAFAQLPQVDLGSDSGNPGETVTIPGTLTNGASKSIAAVGVDIGFDTASLENPQCAVGSAGTAAGKDCSASSPSAGVFRIGIAGLNANVIGNGVVANVSFVIKASAAPCAKPLTNTPSASDPEGHPIMVAGSNGSVTVLPCNGGMIPATVDIDPSTLNVKSAGNFITAYIELMAPNTASQINAGSVVLKDGNTVVANALSKPVGMGDYDSDMVSDLMVKFDRAAVIAYLKSASKTSTSVEFTVTGSLTTGQTFEGKNTVKIISPGK
jgi:hypothetical protein